MPTVKELRTAAKAKKIPKYSKLNKAALLSALGMGDEAKAQRAKTTQRKAVAAHAASVGGDSAVRKAQAKGRILRNVQRSLKAAEAKKGAALSQDEKRAVAAKAVQQEAQAIKSGKAETKGKRGGKKTIDPHSSDRQRLEATTAQNPKLKQFIEAMTDKRQSDKQLRERLGVGQEELLQLGSHARKILNIPQHQTLRDGTKARLAEIYQPSEGAKQASGPDHDQEARAIAAKLRKGADMQASDLKPYRGHPEIEAALKEIDETGGNVPKKPRQPKQPKATTSTKTSPWAGKNAPLQGRDRPTQVRGKSID